jgi:hypothetical protein
MHMLDYQNINKLAEKLLLLTMSNTRMTKEINCLFTLFFLLSALSGIYYVRIYRVIKIKGISSTQFKKNSFTLRD